MNELHLVSHTHWDREWYLPFQQFRLKLVQLVDALLDMMSGDPDYRFFMLDGQTIILEDYLWMRPERAGEMRALVQSGRLLIGPWHILPDEYLASPEATIRNLLQGKRTAQQFGARMEIGYIPDTFGHLGQMPQILNGFGIESACVMRGLSDEPCEFWWQAPDGSRVLMAYMRDGYANAFQTPGIQPEGFLNAVEKARLSLSQNMATNQYLLMQGNDHAPPVPHTARLIDYANERMQQDRLRHSTLPAYFQAVRHDLETRQLDLPIISGELRSSKRHYLLPGVLSARMWIKQRNFDCENILEKWAEPFSTIASHVASGNSDTPTPEPGANQPKSAGLQNPAPILRQAWRLLMENHPHDTICGSVIDQVAEEVRPRFDQVEQIGEEITRQSLEALVEAIDTRPVGPVLESERSSSARQPIAITVFNPSSQIRSDLARVLLQLPSDSQLVVVDDQDRPLPHSLEPFQTRELAQAKFNRQELSTLISNAMDGMVAGVSSLQVMALQGIEFQRRYDEVDIQVVLSETEEPNLQAISAAMEQLSVYLADPKIQVFHLLATQRDTWLKFLAPSVPGCGYRTFWLKRDARKLPAVHRSAENTVIENEFLRVKANLRDGSLDITDKRNGVLFQAANRFVDGGDRGDLYNYCPPERDQLIDIPSSVEVTREVNDVQATLHLSLLYQIPAGVETNRFTRQEQKVELPVQTTLRLAAGVPRLDIHTVVENRASDHRLRVHFPAPVSCQAADYDGHFEIITRPLGIPEFDESWIEAPRPEQPQRRFCALTDGQSGLLVANHGLPEVEVTSLPGGGSEICLTLLRGVGWLSRADLAVRKGHAGPALETPTAQMVGTWAFDYSIIPFGTDKLAAQAQADAFSSPLRAISSSPHPGRLPSSAGFFQLEPRELLLSALKTSENDAGLVVRLYNPGSQEFTCKLTPWRRFRNVEMVNLAEQPQSQIRPDKDGTVRFEIAAYQVISLQFKE